MADVVQHERWLSIVLLCWMYVRPAVPSPLRTEGSGAAIGKYFQGWRTLPSASHNSVNQRLRQPAGIKLAKMWFCTNATVSWVFEVPLRQSVKARRGCEDRVRGGGSASPRFLVEVDERDSGSSTEVRPIRRVAVWMLNSCRTPSWFVMLVRDKTRSVCS